MIVDRFLASQPAFQLVDLRREGRADLVPVVDDRGMLRTMPFAHGLEAFFAAALQRREG
jgi:16S rRNA C967 or C1407 C5-methylase (RsmB/RsmF family)